MGGATVSQVLSEGGWDEGQYTSSAMPPTPANGVSMTPPTILILTPFLLTDDSWLEMSSDDLESVLQNYNDNVRVTSPSPPSSSSSTPLFSSPLSSSSTLPSPPPPLSPLPLHSLLLSPP